LSQDARKLGYSWVLIVAILCGLIGAIVLMIFPWKRDPLSLQLSIEQKRIPFGTTISGKVLLRNLSTEPLSIISNGSVLQYLTFSVQDENGRELAQTDYGLVYVIHPEKEMEHVIEAGGFVESTVAPSAVLDMKTLGPGEYSIQATFAYKGIYIQSHIITIEVVP
jgi:hypothetical protein